MDVVKVLGSLYKRMKLNLLKRRIVLTSDTQVCLREDGRIMRPSALSRGYKRIAERSGITDVRFHDLRHTHASLLLSSGVPIHVVQARLGHESIQTTVDTYGHVLPASDVEAGDKLDSILSRI